MFTLKDNNEIEYSICLQAMDSNTRMDLEESLEDYIKTNPDYKISRIIKNTKMKVTFDTKKKEITLLENVKIIDLLHFLEELDLDITTWVIVPFTKIEIKKEWYPYTYTPYVPYVNPYNYNSGGSLINSNSVTTVKPCYSTLTN